jgi:hypothetical membrane protein
METKVLTLLDKSSDHKRAGILFTLGASLFLLLTTAAESIYPDFSLQNNAISDLAAIGTSTTVIEETAILVLSICWMLGAFYLFRNTGRKRLMVLNLIPGMGFFLAGASPENVNLVIHSVGTIGFPLGAVAAILSYRTIRSFFRYLSLALGTLSMFSTIIIFVGWRVVCGTCGYQQGLSQAVLGLGGWESMIIYPLLIWLIGFGNYLMTARDLREHERI